MDLSRLDISSLRTLAVVSAVDLVSAILILALGWMLARWAGTWTRKALDRLPRFDRTLKPLLANLVRYAVLAIAILAVLNRFGVETTSVIALLGAAGLALGLAIQGTLSDVAAGVMLLILRPFRVGDIIEVGGKTGTVREIGLFTTILIGTDQLYVSMPNHQIFGAPIVNQTREPTRRINFIVGIDYEADIDAAQSIVLGILKKDARVLAQPAPLAPVAALGPSSVDIAVRCWVRTPDYWPALYDVQKTVKLAFDAAKITIPFPQQTVTIRNAENPPSPAQTRQTSSKFSH